ncbi:usg protein [Mongoliimonas terrestris]|uniref:usg protein n=1 Tax=Mongoliimonas terrestris TaxID=1709001 RepID=UPI0009499A72|nr:usg protein [Mongoliimonas terrestris]
MASAEFQLQLKGYGLTTAHILYRLPDHPKILQTYVWQNYDMAPDFPELSRFLDFWRTKIEGALHSVDVAHRKLIGPSEWRKVDASFLVN